MPSFAFKRPAPSGFRSQLPPPPPPHRQSGLLPWAEPARCSMLPFVSEALGWRGGLGRLHNSDESVFIFEVFSKLPLHQLLNSSIQAATDTSRSFLAWGSQWGKTMLSWLHNAASEGEEQTKKSWVAYMFKLIFKIIFKSLRLRE